MAKRQKDTSGAGILLVAALLCASLGGCSLLPVVLDDEPEYENLYVDDGIIDTWQRHFVNHGVSYTLIIDGIRYNIEGTYEPEDLHSEAFVSGTPIHYRWYATEGLFDEEVRCLVEAQIDGETIIQYNDSNSGNIILIGISVIAFLFCILLIVGWINFTDPNR